MAPQLLATARTPTELMEDSATADILRRCGPFPQSSGGAAGKSGAFRRETNTIEGVSSATWDLLAQYGLPRPLLILHAVALSLRPVITPGQAACVALDERWLDRQLSDVSTALTSRRALNLERCSSVSNKLVPREVVEQLQAELRDAPVVDREQVRQPGDIFIDLGPAAESPWIDDSDWQTLGFVEVESIDSSAGLTIISRVLENGSLRFTLQGRAGGVFEDRCAEIAHSIEHCAAAVLLRAALLAEEQSFWMTEFRRPCRRIQRSYRLSSGDKNRSWEIVTQPALDLSVLGENGTEAGALT